MRLIGFIRCAAALLLVAAGASRAGEADSSRTEASVRSYFWAAGIKGDVGVGTVSAPVDVDFLDYAEDLQGALLLQAEVRRGRWSLAMDAIWLQLSDDAGTPGPFLSTIDIQLDTVILSIAPAYRVLNMDRLTADVLVGARYMDMRQKLEFTPDFAAVDTISEQVVETTADRLSSAVGTAVDDAKDDIVDALNPFDGNLAGQAGDAIARLDVDVNPRALDEIVARGGGFSGEGLADAERRFASAVREAMAERAERLIDQLSPADKLKREAVEHAIRRAANESVDELKRNVSDRKRDALRAAEQALASGVEAGMTRAADEDVVLSRDWVDPFVGVRAAVGLTDRLHALVYGDIGGFGVGSDLTWQAFCGVSWTLNERVSFEAGYRHLDIDYDHDNFLFDAAMSGGAVGVTFNL